MDDDLTLGEYGSMRVGRRRRPGTDITDVVVTYRGDGKVCKVLFDGPDLIITPMDEGVAIDWEEDSIISYTWALNDVVRDLFFALAKAFGMATDADDAYKKGKLEGENKVLWQWVESKESTIKAPKSYDFGTGSFVKTMPSPTYTSTTPTFSGVTTD